MYAVVDEALRLLRVDPIPVALGVPAPTFATSRHSMPKS